MIIFVFFILVAFISNLLKSRLKKKSNIKKKSQLN